VVGEDEEFLVGFEEIEYVLGDGFGLDSTRLLEVVEECAVGFFALVLA